MANKKISELENLLSSKTTGSDSMAIVNGGATKKITLETLKQVLTLLGFEFNSVHVNPVKLGKPIPNTIESDGSKLYYVNSKGVRIELTEENSSSFYTANGALSSDRVVTTEAHSLSISTNGASGDAVVHLEQGGGDQSRVLDVYQQTGSSATNNIRLGDSSKYYLAAGSNGLWFTDNAQVTRVVFDQTGKSGCWNYHSSIIY